MKHVRNVVSPGILLSVDTSARKVFAVFEIICFSKDFAVFASNVNYELRYLKKQSEHSKAVSFANQGPTLVSGNAKSVNVTSQGFRSFRT